MRNMSTICKCGKRVRTLLLESHMESSMECKLTCLRIKRETENPELRPSALMQCWCGYICARKQYGNHIKGSKHQTYIHKLSKFAPCIFCNLPFQGPLQCHLSSRQHKQNFLKRSLMLKQKRPAQYRQQQEIHPHSHQVQHHQHHQPVHQIHQNQEEIHEQNHQVQHQQMNINQEENM